MSQNIALTETRRLVEAGAQIVEVLEPKEYRREHLPGAINLPLRHLNRDSAAQLRPNGPIVVYCYDYQ
jgi:rhodanese-related sulfurtransferase